MQLSQIMTRNPETIAPQATIADAAKAMDRLDVGSLPVCDGEKLKGVITDRDIVVRAIAAGRDPNDCKVSEAMTEEVFWCHEDDDARDAEQLMSSRQVRRVPVIDRDRKLVGIVALGDLATEKDEGVEKTLEQVSEPAEPAR